MLAGPARLVGYPYNSSLCVENQHPPAEKPKCAPTRVSVQGIVRTLRLTRVPVVLKDKQVDTVLCLIWVPRHTVVIRQDSLVEVVGSPPCRIWVLN